MFQGIGRWRPSFHVRVSELEECRKLLFDQFDQFPGSAFDPWDGELATEELAEAASKHMTELDRLQFLIERGYLPRHSSRLILKRSISSRVQPCSEGS